MGGAKKKKKPPSAKRHKKKAPNGTNATQRIAGKGEVGLEEAVEEVVAEPEPADGAVASSAWVKLIVRRGRVKTQEWVAAKIIKEDKVNDWVEVEAEGRTLQLKTAQVHIGPTAPTDSTKTMEDAAMLRREVSSARGHSVNSPVFKGPLPYENAVGSGWLQRDVAATREELLLVTAAQHNVVTLSAVSHYESYISLLEHDILHVAADIERRATVVKSLQRSCRDHRRSAELERKHDAMVQQSQGYNVNVAALKAEAIAFRSCPITKKASIHVNHTWKKYGKNGEYMRRADVEEAESDLSFEDLLSEMKEEEKHAEEERAGAEAAGEGFVLHGEDPDFPLCESDSGSGGNGERHISDPFISFGPEQWWWLKPEQRTKLLLKQSTKSQNPHAQPASASKPSTELCSLSDSTDTDEVRAAEPSRKAPSASSSSTAATPQQGQKAKDKRAGADSASTSKGKGIRKGFFSAASEPIPRSEALKPKRKGRAKDKASGNRKAADSGRAKTGAQSSPSSSALVLATEPKSITSAPEVFEEAVHHEMATLSNAKLAGCPCTLLAKEGYNCRCCGQRDAICKVMVLTGNLQTDHPFCYGCLDKADAMLSQALGSSLQYVPLDTINYGSGTRALPDRQPMSLEIAKIRFRAKTAKDLQGNPLLAAATVVAAAANARRDASASESGQSGSSTKLAPESTVATMASVGAVDSSAAAILGGIITSDDQAKLDKLDRQTKSLVESPLTGDHIDWQNGAVANEDKPEVRRVARTRMAQMRRDAVLGFESQAVREGWGKKGVRSSVK